MSILLAKKFCTNCSVCFCDFCPKDKNLQFAHKKCLKCSQIANRVVAQLHDAPKQKAVELTPTAASAAYLMNI